VWKSGTSACGPGRHVDVLSWPVMDTPEATHEAQVSQTLQVTRGTHNSTSRRPVEQAPELRAGQLTVLQDGRADESLLS